MDERNYQSPVQGQDDFFAQGQQFVNDNFVDDFGDADYNAQTDYTHHDHYDDHNNYRDNAYSDHDDYGVHSDQRQSRDNYDQADYGRQQQTRQMNNRELQTRRTQSVDQRERVRRPRQQRQRHVPPRQTQRGSVDRTAFVDQASRYGVQVLADLGALFGRVFSGHPINAFSVKISSMTAGILLGLEILFGGFVWGRILSAVGNSGTSALSMFGISSSGVKIFGVAFGYGLLQMLVSTLVTILIFFLLGLLFKSRSESGFLDILRTIAIAGAPQLLGAVLVIVISMFAPMTACGLMLGFLIHYMIYLYAGFQKCHDTEKTSPYWFFLILILVQLFIFLQTWSQIIKSVLTSFQL